MATTKLYLDTRSGDAPYPLKLTITHERKSVYILLGVKLNPEQWDGNKVLKHPRAQMLNNQLLARKAEIDCQLYEWKVTGKLKGLSAKEIKNMLARKEDGEHGYETATVGSWFLNYSNRKKGITQKTYIYTFKMLSEYCDINNVTFEEITPKWLELFEDWLIEKRQSTATISIHFRYLRAVFNDAIDEGITSNYPFRKFKIKKAEIKKRSLTLHELKELLNYPVEEYSKKYIDYFKLMILLRGINMKDLASLKYENVSGGRIEYTRAKTKKPYSIKIEREIMELLEKLRGNEYLVNIRDTYSNYVNFEQRMNRELKKIGPTTIGKHGKKNIKPLFPKLSTYWARHTFATIAYNDCGIPMDIISDLLGHSNGMAVTNIYIRRNEKIADDAARKVIDKILYEK